MSAPSLSVATDLPTRLLATLEARKQNAADHHPLTIQELAELVGPEVAPEQVHKALGKKPLKERIICADAKNLQGPIALIEDATPLAQSDKLLEFALEQTCTADKPTCVAKSLKAKVAKPLQAEFLASVERRLEHGNLPSTVGQRIKGKTKELYLLRLPPPPPEETLAEKVLRVLEKSAADPSPLTIRNLAEQAGPGVSPEQVQKELSKKPTKDRVVLSQAKNLDAPLTLAENAASFAQSDPLLMFALAQICTEAKPTCAIKDLKKVIVAPLQAEFLASVERRLEEDKLPSTVGQRIKGKTKELYLLRLPPPPPEETLAEKVLRVLEKSAADPSPLTIRNLAEQAGPGVSPEQVQKELSKKPTKDRVVLSQAKNLDAPIALAENAASFAQSDPLLMFALAQICTEAKPTCAIKDLKKAIVAPLQKEFLASVDLRLQENRLPDGVGQRTQGKIKELYLQRFPPPDEVLILAEKMLRVLESQRALGSASYPTSRVRLIELTDKQASQGTVADAFKHPVLHDKLFLIDLKTSGCLIAFQEDHDQVLRSAALVEFLIRAKRKPTEQAFGVDSFAKEVTPPIVEALKTQIETNTLPPTVGWMWIGKKQHIFLIDDVHGMRTAEPRPASGKTPHVATPVSASSGDFAHDFDEAFTRIDRHHGSHNHVNLKEIRQALPVARDVFDAQLRELRLAGRYTLSAAEGRHGLSQEDRDAGIVEDGSLLLYVSRKSS